MSISNKNKIAVTLLSALAFGANGASAMNSGIKTSDNLATKPSSFSNSDERIEEGVSVLNRGLLKKVLIVLGVGSLALEGANETMAGIMWAMGKKPDSMLKGKYSFINLLRSKIQKDDEHPGDGNPEELQDRKKEGIKDKKINKNLEYDKKMGGTKSEKNDDGLTIFLKKFEDANPVMFNKNKDRLARAYRKVSDGRFAEDFYGSLINVYGNDKPLANAVLNFIANKKKFNTDFEVSRLYINGPFFWMGMNKEDNTRCYFVFPDGGNDDLRVIHLGRCILKL